MANKSKGIDKAKFEDLLNQGHSKVEICAILGVADNTLSRWIYKEYNGKKFTDLSTASAGRPIKNIDKALFEELCESQLTKEQICGRLRVDAETLSSWIERTYSGENYSELQHVYALAGQGTIKLAQYRFAQQNPEFSKWWGRQYLGQKEIVEQEIKATVNDTHSQVIDMLSNKVNLEELENQDEQSEDNQ